MALVLIELMGNELSVCLPSGESVLTDSVVAADLQDCCKSGDCQEACEYVLDVLGVQFNIIKTVDGKVVKVPATHEEKAVVCKAIYFDSNTDFHGDERWCDIYLVWEAASQVDGEISGCSAV